MFIIIKGYDDVQESNASAKSFEEAVQVGKDMGALDDEETDTLRSEWYWAGSDNIGGTDWISIEGPGRPATSPPSRLQT